jgi:proteasome lid subunit RPN8/RPN11
MQAKRILRQAPLRFSPYAWAKLLYMRDLGSTEVGAFGVSKVIEEIVLVRQHCSELTVKFEDSAVADYFDDQVDQGRSPEVFARIWVHTHPGSSAFPSSTDEETFERCFGTADWAVMFILARGGNTYARLRLSGGPGVELVLPVEVDFRLPFPAAAPLAWEAEYQTKVIHHEAPAPVPRPNRLSSNSAREELLLLDPFQGIGLHPLRQSNYDPWF